MTDQEPSRDAIGNLALAETLLGDLVKDILRALGGDPSWSTKRAAEAIKGHLHDELDDPALRGWISEVKAALSKRHRVIHALARDRCKSCGQANYFTYEGREVDRAADTVQAHTDSIDDLIQSGIDLARDLNYRIRDRAMKAAKVEANRTGKPVSPEIQYVNLSYFECGDCLSSDRGMHTVELGAVVEASPHPGWRAKISELPPPDGSEHPTPGTSGNEEG